jgi:ABC-type transport system involved in cytochrome c biogenesis permease subunit
MQGQGTSRVNSFCHRTVSYNKSIMPLQGIAIYCFSASYAIALAMELIQLRSPRMVIRGLAAFFGAAGLLAHTIFLLVHRPALTSQFGLLLFLGWIVAVYYLSGSLHYRRQSRGVFVLPVVLILIFAGTWSSSAGEAGQTTLGATALPGEAFWGYLHAVLLLLAAVGVCVGFVASVMYLVQTRQIRAKVVPGPGRANHGLQLPSLERLERMNRWAINLAFPLLTGGVCIGAGLMFLGSRQVLSWADARILGTVILWMVFGLLLYMRYGFHLTGRRMAQLTIIAFVLLMFTLVSSHEFVRGNP